MKRVLPAALLVASLATPASAVSDPGEMLPDPAAEHRAEAIGHTLRCLVCQNESVEESDADLARDLRQIIRARVVAGDSDSEVVAWMVARYGNFVRLNPPVARSTLLLWGAPLIALLVGGVAALLGRRRTVAVVAPLSPEEQARVGELVKT